MSTTGVTLSRSETAATLGIGVTTLRRLEGRELHPIVDERGHHRFAEEEVMAYQPRRRRPRPTQRGRIAAAVFRKFDQGEDIRDIVMQLEVEPRIVRSLYEDWLLDLDRGRERARGERRHRRTLAEERARMKQQELDQQAFVQAESLRITTDALEAALKSNESLFGRVDALLRDARAAGP